MATRTRSPNACQDASGRDAGIPSAPIRVSDGVHNNASASGAQQFNFFAHGRNVLLDASSTSSGPSPQSSPRNDIGNQRATDDLQFSPPPHGGAMSSHNSPLPEALPTPAGTPRSSPPMAQKPSFIRSDTPESMSDGRLAVMSVEPGEIGMALGSPSQQPIHWQSTFHFESMATTSPPGETMVSPGEQEDSFAPLRQKSRRWKLLGGLFGSKKQSLALESEPFYHMQPEPIHQAMVEGDQAGFGQPPESSERGSEKSRSRARANSEKTVKSRPEIRRTNTVPMNFDFQDRMEAPKILLGGKPITQNQQHHDGLMLNVDIPSVPLERYSVMFGSVLQEPTNTQSPLLTRRQATLERLKTVNEIPLSKEQEHSNHPLHRRASSPQPTKSPVFSLFPSAPSRPHDKHAAPSPSPQQRHVHRRANTSPAVPSPSYLSSMLGSDYEGHATPQHVFPSPKLKDHISSQMRQPGMEMSKSPSINSPKVQNMDLVSPLERSPLTSNAFQVKPRPKESPRQIISPSHDSVAPRSVSGPPSTSRSRGYSVSITASTTPAAPAPRSVSAQRSSPMNSPPPTSLFRSHATPSGTNPHAWRSPNATLDSYPVAGRKASGSDAANRDNEQREKDLRTAADLSIARQISVSRKQTELIIPIRTPGTKRANSPSALTIGQAVSPLGIVAAGIEQPTAGKPGSQRDDVRRIAKERLAAPAAKLNTPTLVVVDSGSTEKAWGGGAKARRFVEHRHRNSERVIVESIT